MTPARTMMRTCMLACLLVSASISSSASSAEKPQMMIEQTVQTLLDEFTDRRAALETDKGQLFALVEEVAVPLFDFTRISKLVLASHWRQASKQQREEFGEQFKKLLIGTYATALFRYTGDEEMTFIGSQITERKGRKFAVVNSKVTLSGGSPIAVDYSMILDPDNGWKIYNLTIGGINMVTNYRNTYAAAIDNLGIDGIIESMKTANAKQL